MLPKFFFVHGWFLFLVALAIPATAQSTNSVGMFEAHADIGDVKQTGSVKVDVDNNSYTVTGGGKNMWFDTDAFHFVYKKMAGDVSLQADIELIGMGGDPHRKACLLIRQSLEPTAAYADAVIHGDGLTSIQYRESAAAPTREIQANISKPQRLKIEKIGDYVSLSVGDAGAEFQPTGGTFRIKLAEPFYVGLGVCSHNDEVTETAVFRNVEVHELPPLATGEDSLVESTLEVVSIASSDRRVIHHRIGERSFAAPNWSRDNRLIFNDGGKLYSISAAGNDSPEIIKTGMLNRLNNDHGISPDGKLLAISDGTRDGGSRIYVLPAEGGTPKLVTESAPSYWHGWSPDNKTVVYCAQRNGDYDVYTMSIEGGDERQLTKSAGLDDGPEYSPDGKFIYFNSVRSGSMQIWRMKPDGSQPEQVTDDEFNNWFAHPSPDGRWLAFISYTADVAPANHPPNKDVMIRIMPVAGGEIQTLAKLFGGQGSLNVPSWSPDSQQLAFVSYRLIPNSDQHSESRQ